MTDTIYFYSTKDSYGFMSNFYRSPITVDGLVYPTTEHYFQAWKFLDSNIREMIRLCGTPMQAAKEGRRRDLPLRQDWESVKVSVMKYALIEKFKQHPNLAKKLLDTGDAILVEKTTNDYEWGCGTKGNGKNLLGILLMEIRSSLKNN